MVSKNFYLVGFKLEGLNCVGEKGWEDAEKQRVTLCFN